ncbi:MAG: VacJ family lipoprotein [Methylovulum sp.]|jgi:phospholipid-binding lipoprotein MlaA|nr:MAG: VacJ family lipoprotein [Methylovulum sp.]
MKLNNTKTLIVVTTVTLLNACASSPTADSRDPYENWNRKTHSFNDVLDGYVLKPVAKGYNWIMPDFADQGVSNFFSNIDDVGVMVNSALQGKFSQAGSDSARLVVNTTAGVGGLFDVASSIDLPKHEENFDKTLGTWGLGTGPYLVMPIFGPSSARGLAGTAFKMTTNPLQYVSGLGMIGVVNAVDKRSDRLAMDKIIDEAATDRYAFFKNMYLSRDEAIDEEEAPADEIDEIKE